MRRLSGVISEDVHRQLRIFAAGHEREMQEVIEAALRKYLGMEEGNPQKKN
jgi:plasmid stability protein